MPSTRSGHALLASVAALALVVGGSGCVRNPVTGWPEVTFMSTAREVELGRAGAEQVRSEMGLVESERLDAYLNSVGERVARHSPRSDVEYHFAVVDMENPNAFALPGGWIYVSRGLLAIINSEDELAGVIGHEIGHVAARHAAQRQTTATGIGILALPALVLGAALGTGGEVLGSPLILLGSGLLATYSRAQERQADEVGQTMAAEAGYDPAAMSHFLATLEAATSVEGDGSRGTGFFDSHPSTPERVDDTRRFAAELRWTPIAGIAPTRGAFLGELDGLLIGPDPSGGLFDGTRFVHPVLGFSIRFPAKWRGVNTPQAAIAVAPDRDAQITLDIAATSNDLRDVVTSNLQKLGDDVGIDVVESGPIEIGGRAAYRAQVVTGTGDDGVPIEITWISYRGSIFRLVGVAHRSVFEERRRAFQAVARSFRSLSESDLASISEQRLRVATAQPGETLSALSDRTANAWGTEETAVANDLPAEGFLAEGDLVKVSIREPYVPPPTASR
jgi:predicted Zn-dependent protease